MRAEQTRGSKDHEDSAWYEYGGRFTLELRCTGQGCGDVVMMAGVTELDEGQDVDGADHIFEVYRPRYVDPAPDMFRIPGDLDEGLRSLLREAFALYWFDQASCLARLRTFVEALLTTFRVPAFVIDKKRKRQRLSLHTRLQVFEKKKPDVAKQFKAIKWLGNAGAHASHTITRDDALDAIEIIASALRLLYESERTERLARKITKKKGPLSSVRRARS